MYVLASPGNAVSSPPRRPCRHSPRKAFRRSSLSPPPRTRPPRAATAPPLAVLDPRCLSRFCRPSCPPLAPSRALSRPLAPLSPCPRRLRARSRHPQHPPPPTPPLCLTLSFSHRPSQLCHLRPRRRRGLWPRAVLRRGLAAAATYSRRRPSRRPASLGASGHAAAGHDAAEWASPPPLASHVFPVRELPLSGSNRLDLSLPSLGD